MRKLKRYQYLPRLSALDALIIIALLLFLALLTRTLTKHNQSYRVTLIGENNLLTVSPMKNCAGTSNAVSIEYLDKVLSPEPLHKSEIVVIADLKVTLNRRTGKYEFNSKPLSVGSEIKLEIFCDEILSEINGTVTSMDKELNQPVLVDKKVTFHLYNKRAWITGYLKSGKSGRIVPLSTTILNSQSDDLALNSSDQDELVDILLVTSFKAILIDQMPYYGSQPLIPGQELSFYLDTALIDNAIITSVE
jgi:hypothetical protein